MDNDRTVPLSVLADIFQLKPFRHNIIHLNSAQLPRPVQCILHHKIDLRPVEGCFTKCYKVIKFHLIRHFPDFALCLFPECSFAAVFLDILIVPVRQANLHFHAECFEYQLRQFDNRFDLRFQLVVRTIDMCIILSESTHTRKAVHLTGLFITINSAKLCKANRQISIGTRLERINLMMMRTVHRL